MHIPLKRTLVIAALLALFTAFSGAATLEPKSVIGVKLNYESYTQTVGKTFTLLASVTSNSGSDTPLLALEDFEKAVTWSVDNENVVKIEDRGNHYVRLKLVGKGVANVTATVADYPGVQAKCKVTSKFVALKNFKLSPSVLRLKPGQKAKLTPAFSPSNATDKSISYFPIDPMIASISPDGTVTAGEVGSTYVGGIVSGKVRICRVDVREAAVTSVWINKKTAVLASSTTVPLKLEAKALPTNASDSSVKWESLDTSIAIVSDEGHVMTTGSKTGIVTIRARAMAADNIWADCRVKVTVVRVSSLKLEGPTSVSVDDTPKIKAMVSPTNASYPEVTYQSSDESVATIGEDGTLNALSAGTVTITAYTDGKRKKATLSIRVRASGEPVYRALAIVGYSNPKGPGYLPFATNNLKGVRGALEGGSLYSSSSVISISQLRDKAQLKNAIRSVFNGATDSDVSVLYLATHGYANGCVRTQYGAVIYFREILSYLKPIKGDVVIFMTSCHSGYMYSYAQKALAGTAQLRRTSIFCSTSARTSSAYVNYAKYPDLAYDHFTRALTESLGYDMITDAAVPMAADINPTDGKVTLGELQEYLSTQVPMDIAASRLNHEARYLVHGDANPPAIRVSDPELVIMRG